MLVNRYPVYDADIGPLGFEFVEIDGQVTDDAVIQVEQVLVDPGLRQRMVERNYQLGVQHFSLEVLTGLLQDILTDLPPISAK
jgi:hypothetical protein